MIQIDQTKCIGCGACTKDCIKNCLRIENGSLEMQHILSCIQCGHCVAVCPTGAVSIPEYAMDEVEAIPLRHELDPEVLLRAIKSRRSVRHFRDEPVSMADIERIAAAARYTPTGRNRQEVELILVRERLPELIRAVLSVLVHLPEKPPAGISPELIEQYRDRWTEMERAYLEEGKDPLFYKAPAVLVFTGRNVIDTALAASNAELMVYALGLGCVHVGFLEIAGKTEQIRRFFSLEPGRDLVCCLAIGHPDIHFLRTAPRQKKEFRMM